MTLIARHRAERPPSCAARLLVALGCGLVVAVTGCGRSSAASPALGPAPSPGGSTYTLMQMNLCLSGLADCYVIYGGKPFRCVHPGGRGVFGDAVLTTAPVASADGDAFCSRCTGAAPCAHPRRRWCRSPTATTTSCWCAPISSGDRPSDRFHVLPRNFLPRA